MNMTFYNGTISDAVVLWLDYDGNEVCTFHYVPPFLLSLITLLRAN